MASTECPRGCGPDPPTGSNRAQGSLHGRALEEEASQSTYEFIGFLG